VRGRVEELGLVEVGEVGEVELVVEVAPLVALGADVGSEDAVGLDEPQPLANPATTITSTTTPKMWPRRPLLAQKPGGMARRNLARQAGPARGDLKASPVERRFVTIPCTTGPPNTPDSNSPGGGHGALPAGPRPSRPCGSSPGRARAKTSPATGP